MCGALPKEFDKNYWDVRVVIPDYSCIPEQYRNNFEYVTHFYMSSGPYVQDKYVGVLKYEQDGITYYFIDNQEFFTGFSPYTSDTKFEIEKYTFLTRLYFQCSRLLILSRILYTVMTGRQVFCLYT